MAPVSGGGTVLPSSLQDRIEAIESNQRDTDAHAFQKAVERRARVSFSVAIAGFGVVLFLLSAYLICTSSIGDPDITAKFHAEADPNSYTWPMVAFGTAFGLNFITLLFERESAKFQLALLACYINFLAGFSDYLAWKGYAPVVRDCWGQGFQLQRAVMWLLTTPAMVYLLSIISDFSRTKVYTAMLADLLMIAIGILAQLAPSQTLSVALHVPSVLLFGYVISSMWTMFNASIAEARHDSSRVSLEVLRFFAVGLWFFFPCMWVVVKLGLVDVRTEEWMWCVGDFLGKVMFSSSLLHGNFLTIEQRRLIAMRIVEEGNRIQVIQELKDLVEQKERFMSSMSHELRTPLNGIIGLSDALLVGSCGEVNDQALKTITTIKTSGARLLNLINDILDAASMRKGKLTIKHEKVNLKRVVDDVIDLCQPLAKRGVKLINDLRDNMPFVLGDTGRIIQVFHNLIGNSCKFTHNGYISVSAILKTDEVEVAVSDTGIGIPEEKYDQIFMAFEQVDMSITRKYGGTGLGLSLVKQLVEAHGGRISVKSKENMGTTFFFSLKIHSEHPNEVQPQGTPTDHVAATGEHSQLAAVRQGAPRRAPSRRGSFTDKMLGQRKANNDTGRSGLGAGQGQQGGGGSGSGAGGTGMQGAASTAAAEDREEPGSPWPKATGNGHGSSAEPAAATAPSGALVTRKSRDVARSVTNGPQVSGPMSLSDAAALVKGAIQRKQSFRDKAVKVRVLSVDDDPVNQLVIQNLLAPVGYEILQAMDGQEALQLLEEEEQLPDVILLDVMMPGMSGYEVCRKLREMYPLSCIPVIMISAKSKEEHIVEGLAAGSNDYVVKPFGRQEILARIAAHLRFRDTVYHAGEIAGAIPGEMLPSRVLLRGGSGGALDLAPFLTGPARFSSLPLGILQGIKAGTISTTMQMFEQVTLVQLSITNLAELLASVPAADLLVTVASLFHDLDTLLEQHGCYLLEGLDHSFTIVSGLDPTGDQVLHALGLARSLLSAADTFSLGARKQKLLLTVGIHTGPAQGVLVGQSHPVLHFAGQLPAEVHMLQATCPVNCVHVSAKVVEAVAADRDHFIPAGSFNNFRTFLLKAGAWEQGGLVSVSDTIARWAKGKSGVHEVINTEAKRMRPLQLALLAMAQANPGFLVDIAGARGAEPATASGAAPPPPPGAAGGSDPAAAAELSKLRSEYEALEQQLEEVSNEAVRLQDLVDSLEEQLVATNGATAASSQQAVLASADAAMLKAQVQVLERQLHEATREREGLEAALGEMEQRLVATHAALATANHEAADRARARTPALEPRIETASLASGSEANFAAAAAAAMGAAAGGGGGAMGGLGLGGGGLLVPRPLMPVALGMRLPNLAALRAHGGDMRSVLEELGLGSLAARFEAEDISPGLLPYLDDAAMRELGAASVGARLKLRIAAQALFMA